MRNVDEETIGTAVKLALCSNLPNQILELGFPDAILVQGCLGNGFKVDRFSLGDSSTLPLQQGVVYLLSTINHFLSGSSYSKRGTKWVVLHTIVSMVH